MERRSRAAVVDEVRRIPSFAMIPARSHSTTGTQVTAGNGSESSNREL